MVLTIDAGNTATKIILFNDSIPVLRFVLPQLTIKAVKEIIKKFPVTHIIISSVVDLKASVLNYLKKTKICYELTAATRLPIKNRYKTPATLGKDRLANAVAGAFLFPKSDVLIIDAGTCIKYDFVNSKNEYIGGSISPGMEMRFLALHSFTDKLPLVKPGQIKNLTGTDTVKALQTGVITGMQEEINGFIGLYKKKYKNVKIILTGGDAHRFAGQLNLSIFAAADLVNLGLNEIIRFNQQKKK